MKPLLKDLPVPGKGREVFETLAAFAGRGVEIDRIVSGELGPGESAWCEQSWDECVVLLRGNARLEYADGAVETLKPFDFLCIPAGKRHRVLSTRADTVWLAVHAGKPV